MTNNKYLTNIEKLKRLQPVMEGLGVKPVEHLPTDEDDPNNWISITRNGKTHKVVHKKTVKTYSYSELESVLPDWLWDHYINYNQVIDLPALVLLIDKAVNKCLHKRGQEKLEAMADLILLLHDNNIELRRGDE